ncbi:sprouty-related, EVH1 domain-containing protein 2 [Aethina tumida]|uniref:sprouty-related, EVH1 domain-containing protein 2 n=1 Tax=Aethina tumida TaxID=116153 RepID=UPI00096B5E74|nr:sprouty-related, EVH1 domain-containing protein 2 [Aethina tumida]
MTDSSEDGNYLVRVRAQVMSRDDSSGGWVPLGGGGLSNVSVRKRPRPQQQPATAQQTSVTNAAATTTTTTTGGANNTNTTSATTAGNAPAADTKPKHDYLIFGKRISDNSIVLSCTIKKDFEYNKVMPTFHHWKTGDKKFGLTFQAAADARAFDKGVRTAVEDLLDGFAETSPSSPLPKCPKDVGDDDVFMTLNLPQEPQDSRSSSDSSTKGSDHHRIHYYLHDKPLEPRQPTYEPSKGENYPYVQLQPVHEYIYPAEEQHHHPHILKSTMVRRDSSSSLKKGIGGQGGGIVGIELVQPPGLGQPPLSGMGHMKGGPATVSAPTKKGGKAAQSVCRYCNQIFSEEQNPKGACDFAPDLGRSAISKISCLCCAQCAFYHCASDGEGDFAQHPCDCTADEGCARRWCCLAVLSLFVPCLWLYPPLKLCHWCGVRCGACGGRHAI